MTTAKTLLKCNHCSKEFRYDSERKRHEQSHIPQFACKVCSKTFSFMSALRRHAKQHERTTKVTCDICDKSFKDNVLLKRHIKYAHEGIHTCTKCDSVFNSEPALDIHMRTHKEGSERRYHCSFDGCNKKFNFAHHLKHHELTHTDTKQYFCKICGKGFIQSHHLKTHLKTHSADLSLHCTFPDCNKKFSTEYAKKRHTAKHHTKTDSGISSDSNSTGDSSTSPFLKNSDANDIKQLRHAHSETETRNQLYAVTDYDNKYTNDYGKETYAKKYDSVSPLAAIKQETRKEDANISILTDYTKFIKNIPEDLSLKSINLNENSVPITNRSNDINDCKLAVGGCIMTDQNENCVCAQISDRINEDYDFTPIGTALKITNEVSNGDHCKASRCCGGGCGGTNDEAPEIDFKEDGTVKIKEFMDIDATAMDLDIRSDKNTNNNVNLVPYNSCKAVLGNCIVSGNGTIGDGCLCAKMIIDEQVTAEEIDAITPYPNGKI